MHHTLPGRIAPSGGGRLTLGTFIVAAAAAVALVLLSGCDDAPVRAGQPLQQVDAGVATPDTGAR